MVESAISYFQGLCLGAGLVGAVIGLIPMITCMKNGNTGQGFVALIGCAVLNIVGALCIELGFNRGILFGTGTDAAILTLIFAFVLKGKLSN